MHYPGNAFGINRDQPVARHMTSAFDEQVVARYLDLDAIDADMAAVASSRSDSFTAIPASPA